MGRRLEGSRRISARTAFPAPSSWTSQNAASAATIARPRPPVSLCRRPLRWHAVTAVAHLDAQVAGAVGVELHLEIRTRMKDCVRGQFAGDEKGVITKLMEAPAGQRLVDKAASSANYRRVGRQRYGLRLPGRHRARARAWRMRHGRVRPPAVAGSAAFPEPARPLVPAHGGSPPRAMVLKPRAHERRAKGRKRRWSRCWQQGRGQVQRWGRRAPSDSSLTSAT